jgi:hypothetical protein
MRNLDPIRYAWQCCNPHVPFPLALTRAAASSNMAASLASVHADPTPPAETATVDAVQAALDSFINGEAPQSVAESTEECAED